MSVGSLLDGMSSVLHGGKVTEEEVSRVRETVVFEPPDLGLKLVRFGILLMLAAAISTYGLIADSVATVIGAMIVAPLMLPIMGLAFGISLGDGRAIGICLLVGIGGISLSIAVGYVLSLVVIGASSDPESVDQIMSRTQPGLMDLLAALATGLAGAFAIGRKDVSDTLPGVAIAISLVPPLANAGILMASGRWDLAQGSLLLFATNYMAIVLTGAFVFGVMGYPRVAFAEQSRRKKRVAIGVVVAMSLAIVFPLSIQSFLTWVEQSASGNAGEATEEWLQGSSYRLVSSAFLEHEEAVVVKIEGSGELPPASDLESALDGEVFGLDVFVDVNPSERIRLTLE